VQGPAGRSVQAVAKIGLADRQADEPVALVDRHRVAEEAMPRRETPGRHRRGARSRRRREDAPVVGKTRRAPTQFAEERRIARRDQIRPEAVANDDDGAFHLGPPLSAAGSSVRMRSRNSCGNGVFWSAAPHNAAKIHFLQINSGSH
jgi:hypothetical protein